MIRGDEKGNCRAMTRRIFLTTTGVIIMTGSMPQSSPAQSVLPPPEVLHSAPTGAFFENLEAQDDGSVLFTSYFAKTILRWSPSGITTFATLDVHPVSFASRVGGGIVAVGHGAPFTSGPDFVNSMRLLRIDAAGKTEASVAVPNARFFNGMTRLDGTTLLIADSLAGVIWAHRAATGAVEPYLTDPLLAPVPKTAGEFALGANGVKVHDGHLYVSNSSTTSLYRVALSAGKPSGSLETVATFHGIDDFAFAEDGRLFVATHRNDVIMRSPDGSVRVIADQKAEGATAVALGRGPSAASLFVTTTGGLFAGLKADANLLRLPIPKS